VTRRNNMSSWLCEFHPWGPEAVKWQGSDCCWRLSKLIVLKRGFVEVSWCIINRLSCVPFCPPSFLTFRFSIFLSFFLSRFSFFLLCFFLHFFNSHSSPLFSLFLTFISSSFCTYLLIYLFSSSSVGLQSL